jgi:hypothetical protein
MDAAITLGNRANERMRTPAVLEYDQCGLVTAPWPVP